MSAEEVGFNRANRLRFIAAGIFSIFVALLYLGRLYSMQVVQKAHFEQASRQSSSRSDTIFAKRGEIYDRNFDSPIASSFTSYSLNLLPDFGSELQLRQVLTSLSAYFNVPVDHFLNMLPKNLKFYKPIELRKDISYRDLVYFAERVDDFPGISWSQRSKRLYNLSHNLSHVLGYIGEITPEEIQVLFNQGYTRNSLVGKNGIEKVYDDVLRGKDGIVFQRVDARGKGVDNLETTIIPPELGNHLVLSIDKRIQELSVRALGNRVGAAVVIKPSSGEIVSLVSYPSYNPNSFYSDDTQGQFANLQRDQRSPFLNRAIQSAAAPASTFKIIMTAASLQENAFPKSSTILCKGWLQIGNRRFNDHLKTGHGYMNLYSALAESCNIYYYTLGLEHLGVEKIARYAELFGFGQLSGIDLPGEVAGFVPNAAWKKENTGVAWVGGDTVNLSIGQGYLVTTPLQLANMVSGIVNEGIVYQPHLMKEIRSSSSYDVVLENQKKVLYDLQLRKDVYQQVREAMRLVITDGTAKEVITTKAVKIAGKTGTAQTGFEETKHSWFVAFAPYDYQSIEDVYVVAVWVDAVNIWDWWAPKAANLIYHGIFTGLNYEQTVKDLQPLWYLSQPEIFSLSQDTILNE